MQRNKSEMKSEKETSSCRSLMTKIYFNINKETAGYLKITLIFYNHRNRPVKLNNIKYLRLLII